jgi:hypothetical protein
VKLQTSNGEISVIEVAGVTATSQSGTITVAKVHGEVDLNSIAERCRYATRPGRLSFIRWALN